MRDFVTRRPVLASALSVGFLWVILRGLLAATADVEPEGWMAYVLVGSVTYAVFLLWFTSRGKFAALPQPESLRLALSASPALAAVGLAFEGAPVWSLWTTFSACSLMLTWSAVISTRGQRGP